MALGQYKRAVGVFSNYSDAEAALNELKASGFSMHQVSVIAANANRDDKISGVGVSDRPAHDAGEGAKAGAVTGGALGGLVGLIGSISALTVPGIGPVLAGGAIASILGDALLGGAIGATAGGIIGALVGLGIPEDRAKGYNDRLSRGDYLVIVEGPENEIRRAESILSSRGIQDWGIYDAREGDRDRSAVGPSKRAIGVFPSRYHTEQALNDLKNADFPMNKVSVIAQDADAEGEIAGVDVKDTVGSKADEGAKIGAAGGGTVGGITGLLVGLGSLAIPGVGPIMLAGAGATALATALAGGALGAAAGGLIGGLVGLGIPEERARAYSDRLSRGEYVVMIDGNIDEIRTAESILSVRGIQEWGIYDRADGDRPAIDYDEPSAARINTTSSTIDRDRDVIPPLPL